MKRKFWSSEKLMSIAAITLSLCTLLVFLYQTNLIRKQQYMSVFPYLTFGHEGMKTGGYKFVLENEGVGPAIIKLLHIEDKDGNEYEDVIAYVEAQLTTKDTIGFYYANVSVGRLIPEQGIIEVVAVNDDKASSSVRIASIIESATIELEYESIYGERWLSTSKSIAPVKK